MDLNVFNQSHCSLRLLMIMFLPCHDAPKTEKLHNNGITYQCSENHVSVTQGSRSVNHRVVRGVIWPPLAAALASTLPPANFVAGAERRLRQLMMLFLLRQLFKDWLLMIRLPISADLCARIWNAMCLYGIWTQYC